MARFTILAITACTIACIATAGWEDTGATPAQQPQQIVAAPSAKKTAPQRNEAPRDENGKAIVPDDLFTTFLDSPKVSNPWFRIAYDLNSDLEGTDEGTAVLEFDSHFGVAEWFDVLEGDVEFSVNPGFRLLTDDCGSALVPNALLSVPADFKWTWRYLNGWSFQLGAAPGLYTDIDAVDSLWKALSIPFSGCFYYAFDTETSCRLGVEIRPDWDMVAMPLVGFAWAPSDTFRMEFGVPRTKFLFDFETFDIFAGAEWRSLTYAMNGENEKPDSFTMEDIAISGGAGFFLSDDSRLAFEIGMLANRSLAYERDGHDEDADMDSSMFIAVTFGSNF